MLGWVTFRFFLRAVIQSINIKHAAHFILEQKNSLDVADVVTDKNSIISP